MLQITAFYGAVLALVLLWLSWQVVACRRRFGVGLGHGGNEALARAVRVQANFVEYVPMTLLLLSFAELNRSLPPWGLHLAGAGLLLARLMHAFGLGREAGRSFGRFYGTALNWFVLLFLALWLLLAPWGVPS